MVLLVTPIMSEEKYQYWYKGDIYSFDPRIQEWYTVEDWELEVCRKWGGTAQAYNVVNGPTYLSQTTVTLQGEKTVNPDETILYEVAYYIEDALDRSIEFAVRLKNSENNKYKRVVGRTSLNAGEVKSDYWAQYLTEEYDQVHLGYVVEDSGKMTIITVPIVDNTGKYVPSSDYGTSDDNGISWNGW